MSVDKFLNISSSHIAGSTAQALDSSAKQLMTHLTYAPWFNTGWIITVPNKHTDITLRLLGFSDLAAVLARARASECSKVLLRANGGELKGLELYEW